MNLIRKKSVRKTISTVTAITTIVWMSGIAMLAPVMALNVAVADERPSVTVEGVTVFDGDLISSNATNPDGTPTYESLDIYISKVVSETETYKRLILSPSVFNSYGHLSWDDYTEVDQAVMDAFTTSDLARQDGTDEVYSLVADDDTGTKHWVNLTATQFIDEAGEDADKIYTINATDTGSYTTGGAYTVVQSFIDRTPPVAVVGDLTVALASDTPAAGSIPTGASVEFLKFNLTASSEGDVNITAIKLTAGGLGDATLVDSVALYNDGNRIGNVKNIDSNAVTTFNLTTPLVVEAGTTEAVTVKAKVITQYNQHNLGIASASDITTGSGAEVSGSFPITGNTMSVVNVTVGELTIAADGTPASISLGDTGATIAKFKLTNDNVESVTLNTIILKRDSGVTNSAADDDFENVKLYVSGSEVASSEGLSAKYVAFNLTTPMTIEKNKIKKFVVKADVVDGAGKNIKLKLDDGVDISAAGDYYGHPSLITGTFAGSTVAINAGAVTIGKTNAVNEKVRKDQTDVEFGSFNLTTNTGQAAELSTFKLTVDATGETGAEGTEFTQIRNVELFNKTNNTVYELTYLSGPVTSKIYSNTSMDLIIESGVTNELVVRADVQSTATTQTYTPKIASAITASVGADIVIKETGNDTEITDITPNSVTLKKVTIQAPAVTLSKNPLSASYSAVVGTEDVELLNFNMKANETAALKVTELKFMDAGASSITSSIISEFKLFKSGETTPVKTVSGSEIVTATEEITFSDLDLSIPASTSVKYYLTASFVKDSGNDGEVIQFRLSGYSIEDVDESDAVYDAVAENTTEDGIITGGETGVASLTSARTVTLKGTGSLYVSVDNTDSETNANTYEVGNTATGLLTAIKVKAQNEDVMIEDLTVTIGGLAGGKTIDQVVSKLYLIDSDKTTEIATETSISASVTFENIDYVVGQTSKNIYLKADLNKIGKDEVGVVDQIALTWKVSAIVAAGDSSGDSLTDTGNGVGDLYVASGEITWDTDGDGVFDESTSNVMSDANTETMIATPTAAHSTQYCLTLSSETNATAVQYCYTSDATATVTEITGGLLASTGSDSATLTANGLWGASGTNTVVVDDGATLTFTHAANTNMVVLASSGAGTIALTSGSGGGTVASGDTTDTAVSNQLGVLSSRISSVGFVDSYSGVTRASTIAGTGTYNAAIIKVATDASSNTLSNGDVVKTMLDKAKVKVTKNADMSISSITVEKIGGVGSSVSSDSNIAATTLVLAGFGTADTIDLQVNGNSIAQVTYSSSDIVTAGLVATNITALGLTGITAANGGTATVTITSATPADITNIVAVTGTVTEGTNTSSYVTFDTTAAGFSTDDEIDNSSTVYYVVKVTIDSLESLLGNDWVQVDLDQLNGTAVAQTSAAANLEWRDGTDASAKYPLRIPSLNSVDGTKINEQS